MICYLTATLTLSGYYQPISALSGCDWFIIICCYLITGFLQIMFQMRLEIHSYKSADVDTECTPEVQRLEKQVHSRVCVCETPHRVIKSDNVTCMRLTKQTPHRVIESDNVTCMRMTKQTPHRVIESDNVTCMRMWNSTPRDRKWQRNMHAADKAEPHMYTVSVQNMSMQT
jgi:hypothetical protein